MQGAGFARALSVGIIPHFVLISQSTICQYVKIPILFECFYIRKNSLFLFYAFCLF